MFKLVNFNGNPHVGVFARTNDRVTFIQRFLPDEDYVDVKDALKTEVVPLTIGGGNLVGSLLAMNSHSAVVSSVALDEEIEIIENAGFKVLKLLDRNNAAGNNILCNDNAALVHPDMLEKYVRLIEKTLGVPTKVGTIADLKTVGTLATVTSKGLLCHAKATDDELERLSAFFNVDAMRGTVNHGMPFVGAGLVANAAGAVTGEKTTGIELGRVEEALKLY